MSVTIVLPVSRPTFLPALFASLEVLDCDRTSTNLLVYCDGPADLFISARNFTESSKFASRLCIQRTPDKQLREYDIQRRRIRIAENANAMREHVPACDYVLSLEDDGLIKADALQRLLRVYALYPFAGLVSGVEIGRHGIPHLGLWSVDDVYEPTTITSLMPGEGVQEIDASGMYCVLTKRDNFVRHVFKPFENNDLGPDVEWSLALRQAGYKNYCDFGVWVDHRRPDGWVLTRLNTTVEQVRLTKAPEQWRQEVLP